MRKRTTKIMTSTLLIGMMLPQIAFANTQQTSSKTTLKTYENTEGVVEDIVITDYEWFRDKDNKIHSFNSLGIKDKTILVKAKENPYGYIFKLKNNTYYLADKNQSRKIRTANRKSGVEIRTFDNISSRPEVFKDIKPNYARSEILDQAIERFEARNQGIYDFEQQIKNAIKTVYEMNLEYGGNSHRQGDLSDGKTKCDGFTWIFSELLNHTNIKYRYVYTMPRTGEDINKLGNEKSRNTLHINNEIYNPKTKQWINFENTTLDKKDIDNANGNNLDEKIDAYYKQQFTRESPWFTEECIWLLENKEYNPTKEVRYITETYQAGQIVDTTSYEVTNISYANATAVTRDFLDKVGY